MSYDFSHFKKQLQGVEEWLGNEYLGVRTGRATPAILDGVSVEIYNARTPLKHAAAISIEDAKTLRVAPWDKTQIKAMEKAVMEANLGLSVSSDASGLRVSFPDLTSERRTALVKVTREKLEQARISVRSERDEVWSEIQAEEREGAIAEDKKFRLKDEMQKYVDAANQKLEALAVRKEEEISK
ncbi:MAG: ribosome recycling factor [Parcubacteria group bacterium]|nr:ribosome recycling factor [Parcubacteria group bacterium]